MNLDALPQILFEEHPHPAVIFEPSSLRILAVNEAAVEWYARSRAELLAMTGHELGLPEDTLDLIADPAGERGHHHRVSDGVELIVSQLSYDEGRPAKLLLVKDVSASSVFTRAVDTQEALGGDLDLRETQEVLGLGVWAMNISTGRISWTREAHELFGFEEGEFGGTFDDYLALVHPDDRERVERDMVAFMESDATSFRYAHRIVTASGGVRHIQGAAQVLSGRGGETVAGIAQDVTSLKRSEQELRRSELALKMAGRIANFGAWQVRVDPEAPLQAFWSDETAIIHGQYSGHI